LQLLDFLALLKSGRVMVSINGKPALSLDSGSKSIEAEAKGVKESGLKLMQVLKPEGGLLRGSEHIARKLSEEGWTFTLYERGEKLLTMGKGASALTGHIHVNPLKLRRILEGA
jgi:hypothetical protein